MKVAKSYQSYSFDETKAYEKGGKLYVTATCKCDRCMNGVFVCRVENGQPVPHPYAAGVCFACGGSGIIRKEIRLYTDAEYERMEKANEKARAKRQAEQEEKMKREFAHKKEIWLETNGFNENEETYIVLGNSYSIKDQLKEAGWHYNGQLRRWMKGEQTGVPAGYEVLKISAAEILEFSAWGEGHFFSNAKDIIDTYEKDILPEEPSEWVGKVGEKISPTVVTITRIGHIEGRYGLTTIYTFKDANSNIYVWFTSTNFQKDVGDTFSIVASVKDHTEYNGVKQTKIIRVKEV